MPTEEQKQEMQARYLAELMKIGFGELEAKEIVAEAADRLGVDLDQPRRPVPAPLPVRPQARQDRAVQVVTRKMQSHGFTPERPTWNQIKRVRAHNIRPGMNFMDAMKELLTQDMKALDFTVDEIEYIVGSNA